jgi:hypothetical protein
MLYYVCDKVMQTTQYHVDSLPCNYGNYVGNARGIELGDI